MSLTTEVFPLPPIYRGWWRIYYIVTTSEDFQKAVGETSRPVVLMISSDSNEACRAMKKSFRDTAMNKKQKAVFCLVDIDKLKKENVVERYQVEALPTIVLLKSGRETERVVGPKVDDLKTKIEDKI